MEKVANERLIYLLANFMVSVRYETGHFNSLTSLMVVGPQRHCDSEDWGSILRNFFRGIHGK